MTAQLRAVLLVAALQFVYILDFVMVLPLAPDLALALGFGVDRAAYLTAAYTLASMASALACVSILDRFERRHVLLVSFGLLALATWATSLAGSFESLMAARALTGLAGAPAIATGMALVIDLTAPQERGRAIAKVMAGFSLAAVAGVPLALELSRAGGWQLPFRALAALALVVWLCAAAALPRSRGHVGRAASMRHLLARGAVRNACLAQGLSQFSAFLLIPHFSAYYLLNLEFPRDRLGLLYMAGGVTAFVVVQSAGRLADCIGARRTVWLASAVMAVGLLPFFSGGALPLMAACFVCFMAGNAGRNVSLAAALSHVPEPHERAGFAALQGMVQDIAIAAAAFVGAAVLAQGEGGSLTGMTLLALATAAVGCAVPLALAGQEEYCRTVS